MKFRVNDLTDSTGSQIEFSPRLIKEFWHFTQSEHTVKIECRSFADAAYCKKIKAYFKLSPERGDYKIYFNPDGSLNLKTLFLQELGLTKEKNIDDYFAIRKKSEEDYVLYYVPKDLMFESFFPSIASDQIVCTDGEQPSAFIQSLSEPLQRIIYGAPGTGKSRGVNDVASKLPKENVVRTTFHSDSDYSTFVGAYKPKMESVPRMRIDGDEIKKITKGEVSLLTEKRISYEFVPQAFAKAYVQAWKKMAAPDTDGKVAPVMLVVEEINRGDCAKIFGDLFQLLDRLEKDDENDPKKKAGFSEYPVLADNDFADYVRRELEAVKGAAVFADYPSVIAAENLELMLPPNMYIWATMNTSDQSLFPMDSAFKRRWDWKYVPIKDHPEENWKIVIGTDEYSWGDFLKKINKEVRQLTSSEDKQLGYFFVKTPNKNVSEDAFVNKVLFFLWNVVWKDCYTECEYLKNGDEYFTFRDFFDDEGKADAGNVNKVLAALKIEKWTAAVPTQSAVAAPGESANETSESATESETSATAE